MSLAVFGIVAATSGPPKESHHPSLQFNRLALVPLG